MAAEKDWTSKRGDLMSVGPPKGVFYMRTITIAAEDGPDETELYQVAAVGALLLCLDPHVLRTLRDNLHEKKPLFCAEIATAVSVLLDYLDDLLEGLQDDFNEEGATNA